MSKEAWLREVERLEEEGMSYEEACEKAHGSLVDRLASHADFLLDWEKHEGGTDESDTGR